MLLATSDILTADEPVVDGRKQARASRLTAGSIRLDGRLDDEAWLKATPITEFVQAEPVEGAPPAHPMEVRFLFDDTALWVGARMRSAPGMAIQAPMSRRDDGGQAEYIQVELDTYLDRRTAYMFGVTASGVRLDHYHPSDNEDDTDSQFEPVWEARTNIYDGGWTAELWLPFSQLRFNHQPELIWGLNVKRWRPQLNEEDYWVIIGRTQSGWASRFGELRGLDGIRPVKRLEVMPYVAASSRMTGNRDRGNPFDDGTNLGGRIGADVKVGIGSNLTLEAAINPDFGQIEADPAEVNLTVFETTFSERRPFFIEGNSVLEAGTSNFYYSRRIGARPTFAAPPGYEYVDYPSTSTILGAAKLTGRLGSGTSVGFLGAVTAREEANTFALGNTASVAVAPQTTWGVGRVIQEFSPDFTAGAHLTLVHRDMAAVDPMAAVLNRNAITAGADTRLRFGNRTYETSFSIGLTHIDGEPAAIERVQRASGHYLQRVDQPTIRLDPTRRSLGGLQITANFNKIAGRHWLWGSNLMIESPEFDPLDFGRLNYAGDYQANPRITYRETRPGRLFRSYSFSANLNNYWHFDSELGVRHTLGGSANVTFTNFWSTSFSVNRYFRGLDTQLTRGGPAMQTPLGSSLSGSLRNSGGATTRWSGNGNLRTNEFGDEAWSVSGSVSSRPSPSLQFSIEPEYSDENGTASFSGPINRQYITTLAGVRPETYLRRYIFGLVDRTTLSTQFRVSYTFKPDVTLDVYVEPFAASGRYNGFGELAVARGKDLRLYGTDGTTIERLENGSYQVTDGAAAFTLSNRDFNVRSFRSNAVLRWEWRPGSILYFVWQQNRESSAPYGDHVNAGDLFESFSAPGDNIMAIKTTWWISR